MKWIPHFVRIYTLRGFESPRLDHRALAQDRTVLRGVRERPDHRVCRTQASGRPWAEESLLPSDPRARPRLQDRVHPRLPEPAGASHADPTRAPQGRTATRPRPVRPLRPTEPTGSARLRTPNRRGELPASHPRSYHLLADSGDRSCFERGGLGCGRSQLRVTVPYQPDRVGQRPPLRRVPAQPQSRAKRKGLAYKFARFWALPWWSLRREEGRQDRRGVGCRGRGRRRRSCCDRDQFRDLLKI